MADVIAHRGRVQGRFEEFAVAGREPGQVQAQASRPPIPDLHRREVAVTAERGRAQLFRGRRTAIDLDTRRHCRQDPAGNGWPPTSTWPLATSHASASFRASSVL